MIQINESDNIGIALDKYAVIERAVNSLRDETVITASMVQNALSSMGYGYSRGTVTTALNLMAYTRLNGLFLSRQGRFIYYMWGE